MHLVPSLAVAVLRRRGCPPRQCLHLGLGITSKIADRGLCSAGKACVTVFGRVCVYVIALRLNGLEATRQR